ncbi:MAG: TlpA family protein disulfide reductase [Deltaproteobacteria bacterium]|nr:TlpA family protein disulfide reductase [Deltaproteobacteria bacterium]
MRLFFPAAAVVVAALFLCGFRAPAADTYGGVDTPVPDLTLQDLDGRPVTISETIQGWTLLKFGTTWCPQCEIQVKELNRLTPELERRGVLVVEVFLREGADVVAPKVRAKPRAYPHRILLDPEGEAIPAYKVRVIPRLVLVDPQGRARSDTRFLTADQLKDTLVRLSVAPPGRASGDD